MTVAGKRPHTRFYFVPNDGTLFMVQGARAFESFSELRRKTPDVIFKCVARHNLRVLRGTGQVSRELQLTA